MKKKCLPGTTPGSLSIPIFSVLAAMALFACPGGGGRSASKRESTVQPHHEKGLAFTVPAVEKELEKKIARLRDEGTEPLPLLGIMEKELRRTHEKLRDPKGQPPYYVAYTVDETNNIFLRATHGSLDGDSENRSRMLTVDMRVGSRKFDNTRYLERNWGAHGGALPLEDDEAAIRTGLWLASDRIYRQAIQEFDRVKSKYKTTSKEEDDSDDFSEPVKTVYFEEPIKLELDKEKWREHLRIASAVFNEDPEITTSWVSLQAASNTRYFVSSEGSRIQIPAIRYQLTVFATTDTEDGMNFNRHEAVYADKEDDLPGTEELKAMAEKVRDDLRDLRNAPTAEPYEGPAIFHGKAAAVFFHEVFGHRMEGHRQKLRRFDGTFTKRIGERVMPSFLSIYDDPRMTEINGKFLNGHYLVDDEAVRAERVDLVKNGVLKDFLMSRIPIKGRPQSNGHGRRSPGMMAVARQGNLVVDSDRVVDYEDLRKLLLAEVERQNKPYGLLFREVSGGLTFIQRQMPQSFMIHPVMVYKVYPDGRPDELVRGVDLVGTPLLALTQIVAAANDFEVFNGICGAESGWVPVSATAPSLLLQQIETQRKPVPGKKLPILPPPEPTGETTKTVQRGK